MKRNNPIPKNTQALVGVAAGVGLLYFSRHKIYRMIAKKLNGSLSGKDVIEKAANFIKPLEGFSAQPFWDYKQWSWGYGTSAGSDPNKKPSKSISEKEAHEALISNLEGSLKLIKGYCKKPLKDGQYVALLSFNYNLGWGNTKNIIDRINNGKSVGEVVKAIQLYINAGGKPNKGLIARRDKEAALYEA